jgi:hypothetical protein
MLYAVLCYNDEEAVFSWSQAEDDAVMAKLDVVHQKLAKAGKLGPHGRLQATSAATTIRKDRDPPLVIDGPFAESKEQLLGFYVIDCATREEAVAIVSEMARVNPGGAYEIRPFRLFLPGTGVT